MLKKPKLKVEYRYVPNEEAFNRGLEFFAKNFRKNYDKIKKEANKKNNK